ncbi:hypothetical protein [Porphyromonas pogonae]|uniref:hypothetical protein n=1 Tax=Porphyromonas pogonae TaxID=867595 RepID=UPI002E760D09|nr:hypothetical protein [Porphyromonas pogonae]
MTRLVSITENLFFSQKSKTVLNKITVISAILLYTLHIISVFFFAGNRDWTDAILRAIYTPFTIILAYELYLIAYYFRKSTSYYIFMQYEIITLVFVRGILGYLSKTNYKSVDNFKFISETTVLLFGLFIVILLVNLFYKRIIIKNEVINQDHTPSLFKRIASIGLMLFLLYNLATDLYIIIQELLRLSDITVFYSVNWLSNSTFINFFTLLIILEVLMLLFSLLRDESFPIIVRNTSYIISTVLLKLSFRFSGVENMTIILISILFGFGIAYWYYNNRKCK